MPTNPIIKALVSITELMGSMCIPYMVFGGIANSVYGNPRQTFDIDIKFTMKSNEDLNSFLRAVEKLGKIVPSDPMDFFEKTNVLPIDIHGVRIDLVAAGLPFEREAIERSRTLDFYGISVKVCTLEDLIIQKAVSVREKDWMDIHYLIESKGKDVDWKYLLKHCKDLADFLEDNEIYHRIRKWKDESGI